MKLLKPKCNFCTAEAVGSASMTAFCDEHFDDALRLVGMSTQDDDERKQKANLEHDSNGPFINTVDQDGNNRRVYIGPSRDGPIPGDIHLVGKRSGPHVVLRDGRFINVVPPIGGQVPKDEKKAPDGCIGLPAGDREYVKGEVYKSFDMPTDEYIKDLCKRIDKELGPQSHAEAVAEKVTIETTLRETELKEAKFYEDLIEASLDSLYKIDPKRGVYPIDMTIPSDRILEYLRGRFNGWNIAMASEDGKGLLFTPR